MINQVTKKNLDQLLPLIVEYQKFYNVSSINTEKIRRYFSRFVVENDRGVLHVAIDKEKAVGFSTIYFCYSSTLAEPVAVLNDLYVLPESRGLGIGRNLLENAQRVAQEKGYSRLQWLTAQDNEVAQQLYDSTDARKSSWVFYTLEC
jgi:ribosomal protein S18 acetylase RimI-like enzyme